MYRDSRYANSVVLQFFTLNHILKRDSLLDANIATVDIDDAFGCHLHHHLY